MLSVFGAPNPSGRHASRREFLKVGALGQGGFSLPGLLRAERASEISRSHKAVIMICTVGAPPHQDMHDLKMGAPTEVRGEFKPVNTNERPVHYRDVFATLYHRLGIDVKTATVTDQSGRPQYLLDRQEPIRKLI